jgi:hypothetical protein
VEEVINRCDSVRLINGEQTSMSKFGTRALVRTTCLAVALILLAFPLSGLMVAPTHFDLAPAMATGEATELRTDGDSATSAVSALMAGTAVGPSGTADIDLPHAASAFVP